MKLFSIGTDESVRSALVDRLDAKEILIDFMEIAIEKGQAPF